ncbi:unnamed protein product [Adineta steineri]|uniref:Uncharacterized protein n=1 Tax=Adineta steineri TaxID=433720 RepID=A0A814LTR8_9BILA|nr:unnamed protein product [Adineta steineri]CAF1068557.1 unnamed protein product [Adineta steineri]
MPKTAIFLHETSSSIAKQAQQKWLHNKYPGYIFKSQAMVTENGKYYDRVTIRTAADGQQLTVYFDVTQCFQYPLSDLMCMFKKQQESDSK